jgi:DNA-binding MarR family transcriptional regulator
VPESVGYLVSRIGFRSARDLAEKLAPLDLEPRHLGVLRFVDALEGQSQLALARSLGVAPSRMVALIDDLSERGLVERRSDPSDRRVRALHLTAKGRRLLERAGAVAADHERELCAALDAKERDELRGLLSRIAANLGLASPFAADES